MNYKEYDNIIYPNKFRKVDQMDNAEERIKMEVDVLFNTYMDSIDKHDLDILPGQEERIKSLIDKFVKDSSNRLLAEYVNSELGRETSKIIKAHKSRSILDRIKQKIGW